MLLWQPRKLHDNTPLIKRCLIISAVLHLLILGTLFFVYQDYTQRLCFTLSKQITTAAIVKMLPLSAARDVKRPLPLGTLAVQKTAGIQKPTVVKEQPVVHQQQVIAPVQPKTTTAVVVTPKKQETATVKKKKTQKKKQIKKAQQKPKTAVKKSSPAKIVEDKTKQEAIIPEKIIEKEKQPEEPVLKKEEEKKEQEKSVEKQAVVEQSVVQQEVQKPVGQITEREAAQQQMGGAPVIGQQDFVYVTQQEYDALQIQQKLQSCLFDQWNPPLGVPATAECEVLITIGWDGILVGTEYLKKTNIVLYDLSVQEALDQVTFPHELWGKRVTITFKP